MTAELARMTAALDHAKSESANYQSQMEMARDSRWLKIGKVFGVGPRFMER
jgi:hypothetical protein